MESKDINASAKDHSLISDNSLEQKHLQVQKRKGISFHSENIEFTYDRQEDDAKSIRGPLSDTPDELEHEQIIDENALFEQIMRNKGSGQLSRFFSNTFYYLAYTMITEIGMGLFVINFFSDPKDNLRNLFLFLIFTDALKATFYAYVLKYHAIQLREGLYFKIDMIGSLSYIPIWLGCALYLSSLLSIRLLWLFATPQLALFLYSYQRLKEKLKTKRKKSLIVVRLTESVQNLLIALNLGFVGWGNFSVVLGYYYLVVVLLMVVSTILAILSIVFFFYVICASKHKASDLLMLVYVGPIIAYVIWFGFVAYFAFLGIKDFLAIGGFSPSPISKQLLSDDLYSAANWTVFLGILTLGWMLLTFICLGNWIVKYFMTSKYVNSLSRLSYDLNFGVKLMSDFYFKKHTAAPRSRVSSFKEESQLLIARKALTECIFCYKKDADILIEPCGHAGICQACIKKSLASSQKCPFCSEIIKKLKTIVYNEENKVFLAKDEIDVTLKKLPTEDAE